MTRIEALTKIFSSVTDEVVIISNGMNSREAYHICDRERNFYCLTAMGAELAIGLGVAYSRTDLNVIVISGDGSALLSYNTKVLQKKLALKNLFHIILDNNCYATTGGQATCSEVANFGYYGETKVVYISNEKGDAPRIPLTPVQIKERFINAIKNNML